MAPKPTLLMVDASHFEVSYTINPWMKPGAWSENPEGHYREAQAASAALHEALAEAGIQVLVTRGAAGLPDMVFPANAAVVLDRRAIVARFKCLERRGEEALFLKLFQSFRARGLLDEVAQYPEGCFQEGAGDAIWDDTRQHFWAGFGQRSVRESLKVTREFFEASMVPLELVSPRFYHLDTCFLVLSGGEVVYYPPAFSAEGNDAIRSIAGKDNVIEASDEDAQGFCVNAVNFGREIIMARPKDALKARLAERGYHVTGVDLDPFILSGGGAYCMTLRLDRQSAAFTAARRAAAAE
jgi:N-dimethylarginine dimethylaminohydrolase